MRKQVRRYFRKSLCGLLSAAMIATSLIVPNMTVYATPQDDEASMITENEEDKLVDESTGTKEEGEDKDSGLENPSGGVDGDNDNADDMDSEKDGESGDIADEDDKGNPDGKDEKNLDGDLTDDEGDGEDEDLKSEDEEEVEKENNEKLTISPMALTGEYGTLKNGDFEEKDNDSDWTLKSWTQEGEGKSYTQGKAAENTTRHVSWWSNDAGTLELSQTIENIEPAAYVLSFGTYGNYTTADKILVSISNTSLEADEALGDGPGWTWSEFETKAFGISSPDDGEPVDITITISGNRDAGETVKFDNFELTKLSYTLEQLKKLFEEAGTRVEDNYTAESWKIFAEKKNEAGWLLTSDSTDTVAITLAYAQLDAAMKALVPAGTTLYYYFGETDDEIGLYQWGNKISSTAELASWKVWNDNDTYLMSPVEGYAGWYSIPLTIADGGTDAGFKIYTKTNALDSDKDNLATWVCDTGKDGEIYGKLASAKEAAYAMKNWKFYEGEDMVKSILRNVTLYIYSKDVIPAIQLSDKNGTIYVVDETVEETAKAISEVLGKITNSWGNPTWNMSKVEDTENWYQLSFTAPGEIKFDSQMICELLYSTGETDEEKPVYTWKAKFVNGAGTENGDVDFTPVFEGKTYYRDGKFFATLEEADPDAKLSLLDKLQRLVDEAKELKEENYKEKGWAVFTKALTAAEDILQAAADAEKDESKTAPTDDEIQKAYDDLEAAMKALVPASVQEVEINVKQIALADDFITGADISSYWALRQSGTVFKDENGKELSDAEFFNYLHDGGTNWIRIRVWNDPYDSNGNGYGGGNNDLDKAKIMGKLATDAGMRVLIDFHYSDFWADPGKQKAPKAWADMPVEKRADAVYQFTWDSLKELKEAGVDVGMVQVGNETNGGICGISYGWEDAAEIYNAGSKAVKEVDEDCLVAVHFTNPEKTSDFLSRVGNLEKSGVEYDVLATSYYPYWHGTTENLTYVLAQVAKTYGKKVMVAETSWATTLDDQDGHANTVRKGENDKDQPYSFSVQGQADEIRAVVEAVNNVNNEDDVIAGSAIGVFYWESAWLSPYYSYNDDGTQNEELYNKNKAAWEQYGSGWASSYAKEYDPDDAGKWYGGSAVDNQAWFGFDGKALPTAKVYSYIRTGATTEKAVMDVVNPSITINAGETVEYPEKVTVKFNDGSSADYAVIWNAGDQAEVETEIPGDYEISGTVTCEYTLKDGSTKTETKNVTLTITVKPVTVPGLINPGFENTDMTAWTITGKEGNEIGRKNEDPRSGSYGLHFWAATEGTSTVMQKIENLAAGTYVFGGYIQGDATGTTAEVVVKVYGSDGNLKDTKIAPCATAGWKVWQNPEVTGIVVAEGDYLEVGMEVSAASGGWGTIDDFYLYSAYEYDILIDDQIKHGTVSSNVPKSISGETITVTVTPETGYILSKLMVSGRSVTGATLTSKHGTVTYDTATKTVVLTYDDKVTEKTEESFTMPNSKVTVSAVFRADVDLSALNSLIEEYDQVSNDGYTEESWKAFTDALTAAKAASENVDATQTEIDSVREALEAAYKGLTKSENPTPAREGLWAEWTDEWAELLGNGNTITYTGKAIKPTVKVYDGETLLTSNSYSVSYQNNTKVGEAGVIIKGKGNYTGNYTMKFNITYVGLANDSDVNIANLYVAASKNDKPVSVKPVVTWKGKKVNAKLYEVVLPDKSAGAYVSPGTYNVEVKAKENNGIYKGSRMIQITLVDTSNDAQVLMSAVKVKFNFKSKTWKKGGVTLDPNDIKLTYKKENLTFDTDYKLTYENNDQIGTATVIITGNGKYVGEQRKTFKITGTPIKAKDVKLDTSATMVYNGNEYRPAVQIEGLVKDTDYEVTYQNNTNAGKKATAIITGINAYSGAIKKKFTIVAHDVNDADNVKIVVNETVAYEKGGSKPPVEVTFKGEPLVQGKDYTVSYAKNTKVTEGTTAEVKITGKGNFTQKRTVNFAIGKQSLDKLTATAADQTNAKKWNKVSPVITDLNGKALKKGTDYEKTFTYKLYNADNTEVTDTTATPPAAGMRVEVTATGKGSYEGTITAGYRIIDSKQSIAKARITVTPQTYTGKAIELSKDAIKLELKDGSDWKPISADQYEIVGYSNNINKGKDAKVTIHGLAPYGGTKTFKFEIKAQPIEGMSWAERIASMFEKMFN